MGFDLYMMERPEREDRYWRGLGGLVEAMEFTGVLDHDCGRPIDDLLWPPEGLDIVLAEEILTHLRDGEALHSTPTEAQMQACRDFTAACEALPPGRSPHPDKVAAYKFYANEGHHVVPEECTLIAEALERLLENPPENLTEICEWDEDDVDELLEWIEDWKDYNRVAATHGGYRVS